MIVNEVLRIETARAVLELSADENGRLHQSRFGAKVAEPGAAAWHYPATGDGWVYEPALQIVHADGNTSTDLRVAGWKTDGDTTVVEMFDPEFALAVSLYYRAVAQHDIIETWTSIRNDESGAVTVVSIAAGSLNLPQGEYWLTQFQGDWADEANMVQERLTPGIKILDSKLAVRAHQFRAPWFILGVDGAAQEDSGEVIGGSLGWSGSFRFAFEVLPKGGLSVVAGVNPYSAAYRLEAGKTFETPRMVWGWSDAGTGDLSRKLHRYVRSEVLRDGDRPRAILLNNWESTYFTFDEAKIVSLFDGAKALGMELFLLDDGWFGRKYPRDDDTQGLGDWMVDEKKLPNGIGALTSAAEERGLRFGLWFEPEMVNPRSELFEAHPDWAIQQPKRAHETQRNQMVLDLTNPEAKEYAFSVVDDALTANPGISFVKWDCNRYLTQPGSPYLPADRQGELGVRYVAALYDIMARLAERHPNVEIMMCSGGGGRVDYAAMRYAHELWPSDMTDPVRRIFIQWGFGHFFPALSLACHVTHWGKRPLKFAFDVAMSGRLGMDVDVDKLSDDERRFAASAIETYKSIRDVVQLGELFRLESPYDGPRTSLMYTQGDRAVVFVYSLGDAAASPLALRGLDPAKSYRVREINRADRTSGPETTISGGDLSVPALGQHESAVFEIIAVA